MKKKPPITSLHDSTACFCYRNGNGKKPAVDANPFDDHDEEWDENDNSENVLTDNGEFLCYMWRGENVAAVKFEKEKPRATHQFVICSKTNSNFPHQF